MRRRRTSGTFDHAAQRWGNWESPRVCSRGGGAVFTCSSGETPVWSASPGSCWARWFWWPFECTRRHSVTFFPFKHFLLFKILQSTLCDHCDNFFGLRLTSGCIWWHPWPWWEATWTAPGPRVSPPVALCSHTGARSGACLRREWSSWVGEKDDSSHDASALYGNSVEGAVYTKCWEVTFASFRR